MATGSSRSSSAYPRPSPSTARSRAGSASVIGHLGGAAQRVEICALHDNTFYAKLIIQRDGEAIEVDSRPSDAIALSVRLDAPIFVAEDVLNEVCP